LLNGLIDRFRIFGISLGVVLLRIPWILRGMPHGGSTLHHAEFFIGRLGIYFENVLGTKKTPAAGR